MSVEYQLEGKHVAVRAFSFAHDPRRGSYEILKVSAGTRRVERVVPPAGEAYAFDREDWDQQIEVYVSPSGRSVRVFINGTEIKTPRQLQRKR